MQQGYTRELAIQRLELERSIDTQRDFHDGLLDALVSENALSQSLDNLGNTLQDWLREQIAFFSSNRITAAVDFVREGLAGDGSGFIQDTLRRGADLFGGIGSAVSNLFSGDGILGSIGNTFRDGGFLSGIGGSLIGSLAGPLGGIVGGLASDLISGVFGGSRQQTGSGFNVGFTDGQVTGNSFDTFERERSFFRGTERTEEIRALDDNVNNEVSAFFDDLLTSVTRGAERLGVDGADAIFSSFTVASQTVSYTHLTLPTIYSV